MNHTASLVRARLEEAGILGVVESIAREHRVHPDVILDGARLSSKRLARAKHHVWAVIRWSDEERFSYPVIAALFGVDHTSVMYGVRRWEREIQGVAA